MEVTQPLCEEKSDRCLVGLNPNVVQSGRYEGSGALHGHARGSLGALLFQASKQLLTYVTPLQKKGLFVALRRGHRKAAVAVARKLTVSVRHLLRGHWNLALESPRRTHTT